MPGERGTACGCGVCDSIAEVILGYQTLEFDGAAFGIPALCGRVKHPDGVQLARGDFRRDFRYLVRRGVGLRRSARRPHGISLYSDLRAVNLHPSRVWEIHNSRE